MFSKKKSMNPDKLSSIKVIQATNSTWLMRVNLLPLRMVKLFVTMKVEASLVNLPSEMVHQDKLLLELKLMQNLFMFPEMLSKDCLGLLKKCSRRMKRSTKRLQIDVLSELFYKIVC